MNLSTLSPNEKRKEFERLKRDNPELLKALELITEYFGKPEKVEINDA